MVCSHPSMPKPNPQNQCTNILHIIYVQTTSPSVFFAAHTTRAKRIKTDTIIVAEDKYPFRVILLSGTDLSPVPSAPGVLELDAQHKKESLAIKPVEINANSRAMHQNPHSHYVPRTGAHFPFGYILRCPARDGARYRINRKIDFRLYTRKLHIAHKWAKCETWRSIFKAPIQMKIHSISQILLLTSM